MVLKKGDAMQWHTQAGNIITNIKVEIDFTLTELSVTNIMTWKIHVGEYAKGSYAMILGKDRQKGIRITFKLSDHIAEADGGTFK